MAEYFVDPENGSDAADGLSTSTPWKKIPGQTGANTVTAGDIINVKNGTVSSNGRLIFPANNLTYRGYGLSESLKFTLPTKTVGGLYQHVAVRETGVHEGYWTLYEPTETLSIAVFSSRSGCSISDCCIDAPNSVTALSMGASTSNITGCTAKRIKIKSCTTGIVAYGLNVLLEDIYIENTKDDALLISASASNSNRAGSVDVFRRLSIVNPGYDEVSGIGDALQTVGNSNTYSSKLTIDTIYVKKTSNTKQAMVFADVSGGLLLTNFHLVGSPTAQNQILFTGIGGQFIVANGYLEEGVKSNSFFRFSAVGAQGIATGASLTIKNVIAKAQQHNGFFVWGGSEEAATVNGTVNIQHCAVYGDNVWPFTAAGTISFHPGSLITIGANASGVVKNNLIVSSSGNVFKLPIGGGNDAKWVFTNNAVSNENFSIGTTNYTTIATFEAAHSYCTNTFAVTNYSINNNTQLQEQGVFISYDKTANSTARYNPPTVGPFEYVVGRGTR